MRPLRRSKSARAKDATDRRDCGRDSKRVRAKLEGSREKDERDCVRPRVNWLETHGAVRRDRDRRRRHRHVDRVSSRAPRCGARAPARTRRARRWNDGTVVVHRAHALLGAGKRRARAGRARCIRRFPALPGRRGCRLRAQPLRAHADRARRRARDGLARDARGPARSRRFGGGDRRRRRAAHPSAARPRRRPGDRVGARRRLRRRVHDAIGVRARGAQARRDRARRRRRHGPPSRRCARHRRRDDAGRDRRGCGRQRAEHVVARDRAMDGNRRAVGAVAPRGRLARSRDAVHAGRCPS